MPDNSGTKIRIEPLLFHANWIILYMLEDTLLSPATLLVLFIALIAAAFVAVLRKMSSPVTIQECGPDWLENFSIGQYRPMMRLLAQADYQFLESQPGFERSIARKLKAERRRVFRAYLRNLVRDFHRMQLIGRMMVVYADRDRSDLTKALFRHRVDFTLAILAVEFRYAAYLLGIGTVDVRGLLKTLEVFHTEVAATATAA